MIFRRPRRDPEPDEKPPKRGYGVALGNAMAEFEAVLNPAAEHRIVEMRTQEQMADIDRSGETDGEIDDAEE